MPGKVPRFQECWWKGLCHPASTVPGAVADGAGKSFSMQCRGRGRAGRESFRAGKPGKWGDDTLGPGGSRMSSGGHHQILFSLLSLSPQHGAPQTCTILIQVVPVRQLGLEMKPSVLALDIAWPCGLSLPVLEEIGLVSISDIGEEKKSGYH